VQRAGLVRLSFDVELGTFVGAVLGSDGGCSPAVERPAVVGSPIA
jgi:hypothetical protein